MRIGPSLSPTHAFLICAYWIIAAGTISMQYAFGVIYVELLKSIGSSSATLTALVGSLCIALEEGCGAFIAVLSQRHGERRCAILGGICVGAGF